MDKTIQFPVHIPVQIYVKEWLNEHLSDKILKVFSDILTEISKEEKNKFYTSYNGEFLCQVAIDLLFDRAKIAIDELVRTINLNSCKQEFLLQANNIIAVSYTNYKQEIFKNIMEEVNFEKTEELDEMLHSAQASNIFVESNNGKNALSTILTGQQIACCLGWQNICTSDPTENTNAYHWNVYVENKTGEPKIIIKVYTNDNKPFIRRYSNDEAELIGEAKEQVILIWKNQIVANKIFNYFYKKVFELPMFKNEIIFIHPIDGKKTIGFIDMDPIDFGNYIAQQARKYV